MSMIKHRSLGVQHPRRKSLRQAASPTILTSRNRITRKFIGYQIHTKTFVINIAIPAPTGSHVETHCGYVASTDLVGGLTIVRIDAVVGGYGRRRGGGGVDFLRENESE